MSILGIGPLLAIVGAATALTVIVLGRAFGLSLSLPALYSAWAWVLGAFLGAIGVFFWISGAVLLKRAYGTHRLVTTSVYSVSRNPMYAAFIVFLIPGLALIVNELLFLLISVALFVAFKARIGKEEEYLLKEFGPEFERYRTSVGQLLPFVRL